MDLNCGGYVSLPYGFREVQPQVIFNCCQNVSFIISNVAYLFKFSTIQPNLEIKTNQGMLIINKNNLNWK